MPLYITSHIDTPIIIAIIPLYITSHIYYVIPWHHVQQISHIIPYIHTFTMTLSDTSCTDIDNYIHSPMMETYYSYLIKCHTISHTCSAYNYCSQYSFKSILLMNSFIVSQCQYSSIVTIYLIIVIPTLLVFVCVYCNSFLSIYEAISLIYIYNPYYFCLLYN